MINLHREDWWPTPVWYIDISEDDINPKDLENECYTLMRNTSGRVISNKGGWQGEGNADCKHIQNMFEYINPLVRRIFMDYGVKEHLHKQVGDDYWVNINPTNAYNSSHIHGGSILSGVFYVKCSSDSGNLVIENDRIRTYNNYNVMNNSNRFNFDEVGYAPQVNRLIMFPSWLAHRVDVNKSKEDRISIAFNI